jgi:C-terminal processing protease CtpA/Prc
MRYGSETEGKLIGYVRYIVKGSPADLAGVKRGDLFTMVDGQLLTVSNYRSLLLNSESYKLSFVNVQNSTIYLNGKTATMNAVEITEDPIFLDTVYTVNNQKIGYLVYNSFISNYDKELNSVFLKFKNEGISKLILDLRYNGGGAVSSAIYLASMIYNNSASKLFLKIQYNNLIQNSILKEEGPDYFNIYFSPVIEDEDNTQTAINSLGLQDIYIITTDNTASASEIIINGLKPYINVVTIGSQTEGKYVASMTLKDTDSKGVVNPNHKWALQPIVLKIANSQGVSDFVDGFTPNVKLDEDILNMSVLGDLSEPLLNAAISNITGGVSKKSLKIPSNLNLEALPVEKIHKTGMHVRSIKEF